MKANLAGSLGSACIVASRRLSLLSVSQTTITILLGDTWFIWSDIPSASGFDEDVCSDEGHLLSASIALQFFVI